MPSAASVPASNHVSDWNLTVVRTTGVQFKPPEKAWRPSVHIDVPCHSYLNPPPLVLGRDGQIQNAQTTSLTLRMDHRTRLGVRLMHGSQKHKTKQHLIASARLSLGELAMQQRDHRRTGDALYVRLSCPEPTERSPTVNYVDDVFLLVRLHVPPGYWDSLAAGCSSDESETSSCCEEHTLAGPSTSAEESGTDVDESMLRPPGTSSAPQRAGPADSLPPDEGRETSARRGYAYPPTPMQHPVPSENVAIPALQLPHAAPDDAQSEDGDQPGVEYTWPERLLSAFTPYAELSEAERLAEDERDGRIEGALRRLQKEWAFAAASLLALAGINAAIFGLAPGSDFPIDGPARRVTVLGAITAGLGLFIDSVAVFLYYNADVRAFRRALTGVDGAYFYFCVCCRVPTMCMLVSATCLTAFLLIVAWTEWPSAVIVLSLLAGVVVTLQFLVYGFRRTLGCAVWCMRGVRRELVGDRMGRIVRSSSIHN